MVIQLLEYPTRPVGWQLVARDASTIEDIGHEAITALADGSSKCQESAFDCRTRAGICNRPLEPAHFQFGEAMGQFAAGEITAAIGIERGRQASMTLYAVSQYQGIGHKTGRLKTKHEG